MKRALLLIDYIHDFVDDDGALPVGMSAQAIREKIVRVISRLNKDDLLVLANDCHNWEQPYPEKKLFPPHALTGTAGCQTVLPEEVRNAKAPTITIKKQRYSAFHGTGLADILRAAGTEKLYLAGVCTDISVLHSAVAAYNYGFDSTILSDCVAAFDPQAHDMAMRHFKSVLGFELIDSVDF
jgi:nicotinamidase-related amidase